MSQNNAGSLVKIVGDMAGAAVRARRWREYAAWLIVSHAAQETEYTRGLPPHILQKYCEEHGLSYAWVKRWAIRGWCEFRGKNIFHLGREKLAEQLEVSRGRKTHIYVPVGLLSKKSHCMAAFITAITDGRMIAHETLASMLGVTRRTIINWLKTARSLGLISWHHNFATSNFTDENATRAGKVDAPRVVQLPSLYSADVPDGRTRLRRGAGLRPGEKRRLYFGNARHAARAIQSMEDGDVIYLHEGDGRWKQVTRADGRMFIA